MAAIALVGNMIAPGGSPASGCKLTSCIRSTSTPSPLYSDVGLATPTTNPYVGDADGRLDFYFSSLIQYTWTVRTSDDATVIWQADIVGGVVTVTYADGVLIHSTWAPPLANQLGSGWATHFGKPLPFFFAADYGVVADGVTNDTAAMNAAWAAAAAAGGGILVLPAGTILCTGALAFNGSNVTVWGMGRTATTLYSTYTSGAAITLGNGSTQTIEYAFENIDFIGVVSQIFFKTRFVRGLYIRKCRWYADTFLQLGEADDGLTKPTYVVHLVDNSDAYHMVNETPTLHHIVAENFQGQFVMTDTFVEGSFTPSLHGFYATPNIQSRIDHFIVSGGYFSRFDINYNFTDARIVNFYVASTHLSEGAITNAICLYVTSSTAKNVANVGWEKIFIAGTYAASSGNGIYVRCERLSAGVTQLAFGDVAFTAEQGITPILFQNDAGQTMGIVTIASVSVDTTPDDALQDIVRIVGGVSGTTIQGVIVGKVCGRAFTNPWRSAVRVEGGVAQIAVGLIAVVNCTTPLDDQTSTTPLALTNLTAATGDFINVLDQSVGATRPMTLQNAADYLATRAASGGFLESEVLIGSAVNLTTDVSADIATVTLTPGEWEVWGTYALNSGGGTTMSALAVWLSDVAATPPTRPNKGAYVQHATVSQALGPVGRRRFSVAVSTPVYLGIYCTFAVSTMGAYGYIAARRISK